MNTKKVFKNSVFFLLVLLGGIYVSCTDDEKIEESDVAEKYLHAAKEILQDSIVLNATAMQGTVNKTCLDEGCPLKYYFEWRTNDSLNIQLRNFTVGKMPLSIWFSINVKFMNLNTWEQDEYPEDGWIKFKGSSGITNYTGNTEDYESGSGGSGTVKGYFNARTNEIEFVTTFNVMNFTADVFQQTINLTRMATFEEDFGQYELDLVQCKDDKGL